MKRCCIDCSACPWDIMGGGGVAVLNALTLLGRTSRLMPASLLGGAEGRDSPLSKRGVVKLSSLSRSCHFVSSSFEKRERM